MQADAEIERVLRNLTVVGMLKGNDKLFTLRDSFVIDPPTSWRALTRRWHGEDRDLNLQRITETVHAASAFVMRHRDALRPPRAMEDRQCHLLLVRLLDALAHVRGGLEQLRITYYDDATYLVRATLLTQHVEDFLMSLDLPLPQPPSQPPSHPRPLKGPSPSLG
jgi:hypothetical protein